MGRDQVAATVNLLRLHTAGFEGLVFAVGPMLQAGSLSSLDLATFWLLGVLINGYIFALNDLVDLPRDRFNPAKARSPLVTGALSERVALLWSLCLPMAAIAVTALRHWSPAVQVLFVALLLLGAVVNIYQKVTAHPLLMDVLFAVAMAAPPAVSAFATSGSVAPVVWWACGLLFLLSLQLNSVAGNLKDLASDRRTGFRTVAISMGADLTEDGRLLTTREYNRYCWTLLACVHVAGATTLWFAAADAPAAVVTACAGLLVLCAVTGALSLDRLLKGRRKPASSGRELYFAAGFLILLVAVAVRTSWQALVVVLVALVAWEAGFRLYWSRYWRLAERTAKAAV